MDSFLLLLGLGVLALPIVAIVALVMSIGNRKRLAMLDLRFSGIERSLRRPIVIVDQVVQFAQIHVGPLEKDKCSFRFYAIQARAFIRATAASGSIFRTHNSRLL